ncbi:MAG TPA: glycosyltransferase family 39 protein, partial [Dongiaceae bacterium]|nr:glycosyltransferase family 39 protein [Dongiaceae bacterium]
RPPLARGPLLGLLAATVALHLTAITRYGWFRDELYYLSCAKRLAWGYVDQPPLSIALLAVWRAAFGATLAGVRVPALIVGLVTILVTMQLARALGGGRWAQFLAGLCVVTSPIHRAVTHYYSMNVIDMLAWPLAGLALIRALRRGHPLDWGALGLVLGLGLLNKLSMVWCAGGLAIGLLVTPLRTRLATAGPWLAAAVAAAIFSPHLVWQVEHGWPTLEWIHNATAHKMLSVSLAGFALNQLLLANPLAAPVWITGLVSALRGRRGSEGRVFGVQYVAVFVLLVVSRSVRVEYLAPTYATLFALGAVALERMTGSPSRAPWRPAFAVLPILGLALLLPLVLPVLPVGQFLRFQSALGMRPHTEERHAMGQLPQHYADMFGWPEIEAGVARACATLTPVERGHAVIYVHNYGEAGAIELLGERDRLPPVICGHNNWWLWGPGRADGRVIVVVGAVHADEVRDFQSYTAVDTVGHPLAMPYERDLEVGVGRGLRFPIAPLWPRMKDFN